VQTIPVELEPMILICSISSHLIHYGWQFDTCFYLEVTRPEEDTKRSQQHWAGEKMENESLRWQLEEKNQKIEQIEGCHFLGWSSD
jgi:hypothetical protein